MGKQNIYSMLFWKMWKFFTIIHYLENLEYYYILEDIPIYWVVIV